MLTGKLMSTYMPSFLVAPIFIMKRHFGAIFLGDLILWRSKFFAKLFWWFLKIGEFIFELRSLSGAFLETDRVRSENDRFHSALWTFCSNPGDILRQGRKPQLVEILVTIGLLNLPDFSRASFLTVRQ